MAHIERMTGVSTGGVYLAAVSQTKDSVTVTPIYDAGRPTLMASKTELVKLPPALQRLMNNAGIEPPAVGQQLNVADLNAKLTAANMATDDRINLKKGLANLGVLSEGNRVDVFG